METKTGPLYHLARNGLGQFYNSWGINGAYVYENKLKLGLQINRS